MGAWGENPKDNDTSADMFGPVAGAAGERIDKMFRTEVDTHSRWERLGVLQLAIEGMPAIVPGLYDAIKVAAYSDIPAIEADSEWIDAWGEPKKVRAALKRFGRQLEAIIAKG